jgi:predicted HTH domain antitoxin
MLFVLVPIATHVAPSYRMRASRLAYRAATAYRCLMPISVTVPDDVLAALKLPPRSVESDLRRELAVHLVAEGLLPVASACRLAGWSRLAFERLLGERKIPTGYTTDDLEQDVQTLSPG